MKTDPEKKKSKGVTFGNAGYPEKGMTTPWYKVDKKGKKTLVVPENSITSQKTLGSENKRRQKLANVSPTHKYKHSGATAEGTESKKLIKQSIKNVKKNAASPQAKKAAMRLYKNK